jgi:hypothetical protein
MGTTELEEPSAPVARGGQGGDAVRMASTPCSSVDPPFEGEMTGLTPVPDQGPVVVASDENMVVIPPSPVLGRLGDSMHALCSYTGIVRHPLLNCHCSFNRASHHGSRGFNAHAHRPHPYAHATMATAGAPHQYFPAFSLPLST